MFRPGNFLPHLLGLLLLALGWPTPTHCRVAEPGAKPNIVVIVSDDHGYGDLGVHGCQDIPTPHLDFLAKNGPTKKGADRPAAGEAGSDTASGAREADKPVWIEPLFRNTPAGRLRLTESGLVPGRKKPVARVVAEYTYLDPHGQEKTAKAKLFLPDALQQDPKAKVPLYYSAGYEVPDAAALTHADRGWAVVSPAEVNPNPLIRTANPDVALLHIARALPFVEDSKVVIGGGSAGGYMTLMLAAETFPLAGTAPDAPPINWGYNGAYFFKQMELANAGGPQAPKVPAVAGVGAMLEPAKQVYGTDYGDLTWFRHSPLGHVATITCPVSVLWSTADVLVPIDQVGVRWVRPFDPKAFPDGFTMDPTRLTATREGRLWLTDVLAEKDYEVFDVPVPDGAVRIPTREQKQAAKKAARKAGTTAGVPPALAPKTIELPVSATRQWSVVILDEGRPSRGWVISSTWSSGRAASFCGASPRAASRPAS